MLSIREVFLLTQSLSHLAFCIYYSIRTYKSQVFFEIFSKKFYKNKKLYIFCRIWYNVKRW